MKCGALNFCCYGCTATWARFRRTLETTSVTRLDHELMIYCRTLNLASVKMSTHYSAVRSIVVNIGIYDDDYPMKIL